jgi:hypothetical protein
VKLTIRTVGRNLREIPRCCFLESVLKARCSLKADQISSAGYVETPRRLTIGLRRVPRNMAVIPNQLGDHVGKVADAGLNTSAYVDGFRSVKVLGGKQ